MKKYFVVEVDTGPQKGYLFDKKMLVGSIECARKYYSKSYAKKAFKDSNHSWLPFRIVECFQEE